MYEGFVGHAAERRHDAVSHLNRERRNSKNLAEEFETNIRRSLSEKEQATLDRLARKLKLDIYDVEFFRILLIASDFYEQYRTAFESIPAELEKHRKQIEEYAASAGTLTEEAQLNVEEIEKCLTTVQELSAQTDRRLHDISKSADDVVDTMTRAIHFSMRRGLDDIRRGIEKVFTGIDGDVKSTLDNMRSDINAAINSLVINLQATFPEDIKKGLQLGKLEELNKTVTEAIEARKTAVGLLKTEAQALKEEIDTVKSARAAYRADIKAVQWANWRWCSIAMAAVILCSCVFFHFHYSARLEAETDDAIARVGENSAVLDALAETKRRLELTTDDKGAKLLIMKNAKGWTSADKKHGVIEFKE